MTESGKGSFDFKKFTDAVAEAVHKAKDATTSAANEHRGKVHDMVDKAAATVDEKTQGKYSDKVAKAKGAAHSGFDKVADAAPGRSADDLSTSGAGHAADPAFPVDREAPANDPREASTFPGEPETFPVDPESPSAEPPSRDAGQ